MASVRLVNVTKRFGKTDALKNMTLEVNDKEFFVISGPPGVGKTTFLRIIAGLESPDEGEVYIGDDLMSEVEPRDRDVSMVFENLALYPNKTAYQNIRFPLKQRKTPEDEIRARVMDVAHKLLIEHLLDRNPGTFSGGERQRVALARAMVRRPRVYLLDQPLANLDAKIRESMRVELKRLAKELGTIIYTTHDQQDLSMADRVAVFNGGEVQQCSTPEEVYSRPQNKFVAGFVGSPSMNFICCTYEEEKTKAFLSHRTFSYDVTAYRNIITEKASNKECILGLRPQDIRVVDEPTSKDAIEGVVYVVEPMGPRSVLTLQVGEDLIKALVVSEFKAKTGDKKYIEFDNNKIHIFDRKTEKAII